MLRKATAPGRGFLRHVFALLLLTSCSSVCPHAAGEEEMDYRFAFSLHHPIQDALSGAVAVEYRWNPQRDYDAYVLGWPNLTYKWAEWLQLTGGLRTFFTSSFSPDMADTRELRPFAGVKLLIPNDWTWHLFNYTRYEYRDVQDRDTYDHNGTARIRSQFGVEIPLGAPERAWKPGSSYLIATAEPFYRMDRHEWDPVQVGVGLGHILSRQMRAELVFIAQFSRPATHEALEFDQGILRLSFKVGLDERLLERLINPSSD